MRFYKIPEQTDEDCIDTLEKIISNDLNLEAAIENAHRIGPSREDGSPRPIIAKFLYRPERRDILRKKKLLKNGIYISEDLIPEDSITSGLKKSIKRRGTINISYIGIK